MFVWGRGRQPPLSSLQPGTARSSHAPSLCAVTQRGQAPSSRSRQIGAFRLKPGVSVLQNTTQGQGTRCCTIRLKFPASGPVPSPSAFGLTPNHPSLAQLCAGSFLAAQTAPAPCLVKSSSGEGLIPAGADRLAGACILVMPRSSGSTTIRPAARSATATCSLCYGGPPPLPFTP